MVSGKAYTYGTSQDWQRQLTWREIFALISPYLIEHPNDSLVKSHMATALAHGQIPSGLSASLDNQIYQTIKIQFQALNLVNVDYTKTTAGGMGLFWSLTEYGYSLMMELRTIKSNKI